MSNVGIPGSTASHVVPFFAAANVKLRLHGLTLPRVDGSMLCSMAMVEATKIPMVLKSRKVVYISLKTEFGYVPGGLDDVSSFESLYPNNI